MAKSSSAKGLFERLALPFWAVNYFCKLYGIPKTLKGMMYLSYRRLRELSLKFKKEYMLEVNGYKLVTIPNDIGISSELLIFQTHEPLSTEVLKGYLKKGMVCLDVGANIGYYALLERTLVGGDGEAAFLVTKKSNLSRMANKNDLYLNNSIIKVPVKRLDSFILQNHIRKLDFLRMDVEGHEKEIVAGGMRTLERLKPAIFIEIHKSLLSLKGTINFLRTLEKLGYDSKYLIPRELDMPFIGCKKDVKIISINKIIEKLYAGKLPDCFHLLLVNS
jgi:hypothetical protein